MADTHAAVWLDHADAHVLHFKSADVQNKLARSDPFERRQFKRATPASARLAEDQAYFESIAASLGDAAKILVTGPANATAAFVNYLNERARDLRAKVITIETLERPSDAELLDHARKHFRAN